MIKFSTELKGVISQSFDIAADLQYDYISTLHFFLADCERKSENSIFKFAFKNDEDYQSFKKKYVLEKLINQNLNKTTLPLTIEAEKAIQPGITIEVTSSLPLTIDAEKAIKLSEVEAASYNQYKILPCHLFISALKNKDSHLFKCFNEDKNILLKSIEYYKNLGEFEKYKMPESEIPESTNKPEEKSNDSLIEKTLRFLKLKK
jgi:hypothetical protein